MWKATWKGLLGHKLRLALTALAVVLGISFVSGTFVLTDTLLRVFDSIFEEAFAGFDVLVQEEASFDDTFGGPERGTFDETVVDRVRSVDGVQAAEGSIDGNVQLVIDDKPVTTGGAPIVAGSWATNEDLSPLEIRQGRPPTAAGHVVLDVATARSYDVSPGEVVTVIARPGPQEFTVTGLIGFGDVESLAGASIVAFPLDVAQALFGQRGQVDSIAVAAEPGIDADELAARIEAVVPESLEAISTQAALEEQATLVYDAFSAFTVGLLVFAGVALFVGAFIIFNTFSIIVAQRSRELALLRALGASRRQVLTSVLAESVVIGFAASAVGLAGGILVASGLRGLLNAFGLDLPSAGNVILPRTVIVALVTGTLITALSSILPARRASRISPVEALREHEADAGAVDLRRALLGAPVTTLGLGLLLLGLNGVGHAGAMLGVGAAVVFIGMGTLAPGVARPIVLFIGGPLPRLFKLPGKLARENAARNPRRTASTAAALMIGLALVSFVAVFAASLKASASKALSDTLAADFIITAGQGGGFRTFPPVVADALQARPEIGNVTGLRAAQVRYEGDTQGLAGADPAALDELADLDVIQGSLPALGDQGVFVFDEEADARGLEVGDRIDLEFGTTGVQTFSVEGIFGERRLVGSNYLISIRAFERNTPPSENVVVLADAAEGVQPGPARAAVEEVIEPYPILEVADQAEFRRQQEGEIDQLLGLVTALLGLAILIALLGIANTLALSIFERTRELGLLRAVGMSRRQVRKMIRWEAVMIAVLGAVLGLPIGVFFAWAAVATLQEQGFGTFAVPPVQLAVYVVLAGLAGLLAAVLPARRAARINVLDAIRVE